MPTSPSSSLTGNFLARFLTWLLAPATLGMLCAASFIARAAVVWLVPIDYSAAEDYGIALNLVAGKGYSFGVVPAVEAPTAIKLPFYPFLLAGFILIFGGGHLTAIVLFQHLLIALTPLLMRRLGRQLGHPALGSIAGLLFLCHPTFFYYPCVLEITNIFIPMAALWLLALFRYRDAPDARAALQLGTLSAILILTHAVAALPMLAGLLAVSVRAHGLWAQTRSASVQTHRASLQTRGLPTRPRWQYTALIFTLTFTALSLWITRNYIAFGTPTVRYFWINAYYGTLEQYNGFGELVSPETRRRTDSLSFVKVEAVMDSIYKSATLEAAKQQPERFALKTLYQAALYWWVAPRYLADRSLGFWLVRKLPVIVLNALFLIGLIAAWRTHRSETLVMLLLCAYFTAAYALTQIANTRYKLDLEWLEFFFIAVPVEQALRRFQLLQPTTSPP